MKGYKKVIAVLMAAAMMFCGTAVFAADAAPEAGETLIMGDNFDDVRQTGNYEWNGLTLQEGENGNIGLVEAGTEATLGYGSLSISNFILKFNAKVSYADGDAVPLAKIKYTDNSAIALTFLKNDGSGFIQIEATGGKGDVDYDIAELADFDTLISNWMNIKIVSAAKSIEIYINNEKAIELGGYTLGGGAVAFGAGKSSPVYIDNVYFVEKNSVIKPFINPYKEKRFQSDDFEEAEGWYKWSKRTVIDDGTGTNKVMKNDDYATYGVVGNKLWIDNYTLQFNADYSDLYNSDSGWKTIITLRVNPNNSGKYYTELVMENPTNTSNGKIIILTKSNGNTICWYEYEFENKDEFVNAFTNMSYFKCVLDGSRLQFYVNDADTPIIDKEDALDAGGIGGLGIGMAIVDNMIISTPIKHVGRQEPFGDLIIPQPSADRYTILYEDYDDFTVGAADKNVQELLDKGWAEFWSNDNSGAVADGELAEGNKAFSFTGTLNTGNLKLSDNYTIEFNMKVKYIEDNGEWKNICPLITVNRSWAGGNTGYRFGFGTETLDGKSLNIQKLVSGTDVGGLSIEYDEEYPLNYYDADNEWAYFKIERVGNVFKLYFNDKDRASVTFTDNGDTVQSGSVYFDAWDLNTTYLIDNLLISAPEFPKSYVKQEKEITKAYNEETDSTEISVALSVINNYETARTATVITAIYSEDGKLVELKKLEEAEIPARKVDYISSGVDLTHILKLKGNMTNGDVKVFIFDGIKNIMPLIMG